MLKNLVHKYIEDPMNDIATYNVAIEFYNQGHTASAMSYFLRCAEITNNDDLAYRCMCFASNCLFKQGNRIFAAKGSVLHAISILPERPEAHFLYARILEINREWQECYSACCTALKLCNFELEPYYFLEYPGKYGFLFEKAVSGYQIGRSSECRELFADLYFNVEMNSGLESVVNNNMDNLNISKYLHTYYDRSKFYQMNFPFPGLINVEKNYSQSYQDLFVLSCLKGKREGNYLEIGSAQPFYGNNTALLETVFDWKGISIEIEESLVNEFKSQRKNEVIQANALDVDYSKILDDANRGTDWDYLQLDCDPPQVTYEILKKIPFDKYKFAVITYEHDFYADEFKIYKSLSRNYLRSKGYILMVNDIAPDKKRSFEDWWVHPDLIDTDTIEKMIHVKGSVNKAEDYMLK